MRIDSSGNVGIGVTPSAWSSSYKVLEIGSNSIVNGLYVTLASNAYNNGTNWIYKTTNFASKYESNFNAGGIHAWFNAPSGTAGNAITFTQAMTLDASGNLLVGTTSNAGSARVNVSFSGPSNDGVDIIDSANGSGSYYIAFRNSAGTAIGTVSRVSTTNAVTYNTTSDYRLKTVIGVVTGHGERIDALKPIDYQWKENNAHARGFLAHEFQEVYASSVTGTKDAVDADGNPVYQGMQASSTELIADLVAEIQSLRKRLAALESKEIS
jgi:hypothetical protein